MVLHRVEDGLLHASMRPRVIPAEVGLLRLGRRLGSPRFNEAAGHPRGSHGLATARARGLEASMRPRVIPAEVTALPAGAVSDLSRFNEAAGHPRGSRLEEGRIGGAERASMRPRVIPAEVARRRPFKGPLMARASMRPRVIPAEVGSVGGAGGRGHARFNEAAGHPRGSRPASREKTRFFAGFNEAAGHPRGSPRLSCLSRIRLTPASMRPRVIPAEVLLGRERDHGPAWRFNEAAGHPRGSRPPGCRAVRGPLSASMRPRVIPAEVARKGAKYQSDGQLQ